MRMGVIPRVKNRTRTMQRYLVAILTVSLLASGVATGCAPDLPKEEKGDFYATGYMAGYSWGYWLTAEDKDRGDIWWTPPDRVDEAQELHPGVNIRDFYIPKGYWMMSHVANAQFPDGTPFNDKQKKQLMETNNWGFYDGFMQGCKDCVEGKPDRFLP